MPFQPNMPTAQEVTQPPSDTPAGGEQMNPVIDALKTLQVFVASLKEKEPAKAQQVQEAMMNLLQALQGGGEKQNENETNPPSNEGSPEAPGNQGDMGRAPSRPISMNSGKNIKPVPIL